MTATLVRTLELDCLGIDAAGRGLCVTCMRWDHSADCLACLYHSTTTRHTLTSLKPPKARLRRHEGCIKAVLRRGAVGLAVSEELLSQRSFWLACLLSQRNSHVRRGALGLPVSCIQPLPRLPLLVQQQQQQPPTHVPQASFKAPLRLY